MMALSRAPDPAVPAAGVTVCAVATTLAQRARKTAIRWFSTGENSLARGGLTGDTGWVLIGWWCDLGNRIGLRLKRVVQRQKYSLALATSRSGNSNLGCSSRRLEVSDKRRHW